MVTNSQPTRIDPTFERELLEIAAYHNIMKTGRRKKKVSIRRVTQAIPRSSIWPEFKEVLKNANFVD